ncbi:MAG: hypothetical protein ACFB12_02215 [Leptolyngbyaceae cyanobacterium]
MMLAYLALFGVGLGSIWLAFRIAEEVIRIALVSTGAIAMLFGFFHSPAELQFAVEAVSLGGGWLTLRSR